MRFVPVKSAEGQAAPLDHKARGFLIRQHTQTVNTIRAHLAEFGIIVAKGIHNVHRLLAAADEVPDRRPHSRPAQTEEPCQPRHKALGSSDLRVRLRRDGGLIASGTVAQVFHRPIRGFLARRQGGQKSRNTTADLQCHSARREHAPIAAKSNT
jgi:transposase